MKSNKYTKEPVWPVIISLMFVIGMLLYNSGCAALKHNQQLQVNMQVQDMIKIEAQGVIEATYNAAIRLDACQYFKEQYPKEYRLLHTRIHYGFTVKKATWQELEGMRIKNGVWSVAGYCKPAEGIIGIDSMYINCRDCDLEELMAHELLHLALVPNHSVPMQPNDEFTKLTRKCGY